MISINIGESILEMTNRVGQPQRTDLTGNVHMYQFLSLPPNTRIGVGEKNDAIQVSDIEGLILTTDQRIRSGRLEEIDLEINPDKISSHEKAFSVVNNLIAQFQKGKWQRFIPSNCPYVTGRSSIVGLSGTVDDRKDVCPIDPSLSLSVEEFSQLSSTGVTWQWIADNRIATLEVNLGNSHQENISDYTIGVKFETKESYDYYDRQSDEQWIKDRGEEGAKEAANQVAAEVKLLEEAALKRGDRVLPRP